MSRANDAGKARQAGANEDNLHDEHIEKTNWQEIFKDTSFENLPVTLSEKLNEIWKNNAKHKYVNSKSKPFFMQDSEPGDVK